MPSDKTQIFQKALSHLNVSPSGQYRVLDFGCGKGEFLGLVAQLAGSGSELIGVDARQSFIQQAQTDYPELRFICDKFTDRFTFPDAWFDVVVTIDTIECIPDKDALVREIHRVLKPRGQVLAMHCDWDTQLYNTASPELVRKAVWAFSDWQQPWMDDCDGLMGRKLWGLFEASGKFQGSPDAFTLMETEYEAGKYGFDRMKNIAALVDLGEIGKDDYERLCQELQDAYAERRYFYSITSFIYKGEKVKLCGR